MLSGGTLLLPRPTISLRLLLGFWGNSVLFQVFSTLVLSEAMGKVGRLQSSCIKQKVVSRILSWHSCMHKCSLTHNVDCVYWQKLSCK